MNKFLIALVLVGASLSVGVAKADTLLIESHSWQYSFAGTNFRFNDHDGTAWMIVGLSEDLGAPDMDMYPHGGPISRHETVTASVPGLSYDTAAAQIVFTGNVGKVVCGTVTEKKGVFGMKQIITLTGACRTYSVRGHNDESVYFEVK
jgi:hypothetical protein